MKDIGAVSYTHLIIMEQNPDLILSRMEVQTNIREQNLRSSTVPSKVGTVLPHIRMEQPVSEPVVIRQMPDLSSEAMQT